MESTGTSGSPFALEAAAIDILYSSGGYILETQDCGEGDLNSISQRSELKAVMGALHSARDEAKTLEGQTLMDVTIYIDSQYAYD